MSFVKRILQVTVKLATDPGTNQPATFTGIGDGGDTATFENKRTTARIQNSGAPGGSMASISVYGLTLSVMDQLSTLGMVFSMIPRNTLTVQAGDSESGLSTVFAGTIIQGYADFNASPDVPFNFECQSGLAEAVIPVPATSYKGSTDVGTIMSSLAKQMNLGFENNGVSQQVANPYYPGSALQQMRRAAEDANINAEIVNGVTLAIWPKGGSRGGAAVLVAPPPAGGMILYPSYTQQGIMLKTVFNPQIGFGGLVNVRSLLKKANGTWAVYKIDHALDSQVPRGKWESTIYAYNPKYPQPIPPQV